MFNRIIHSDNGTLTDYSVELDDYYSGSASLAPFTAAQDYLFFGARLPFNHLYFKFSTANTAASNLTIAVWDGNAWNNVAETLDGTKSSGASFGQDGYISWVPDKQKGWGREDTVNGSGTELVTGLGNVTIYDRYWVRFAFSADLDNPTALDWCGQLFSDDNLLGAEFPDLVRSTLLANIESGKTTWEEQHVRAAEIIADDLVDRKVIVDKRQILERRDLARASVSKVAEMAFVIMGDDYSDDKEAARKEYNERISKNMFAVDRDNDARIDTQEIEYQQGTLTRGPRIISQRSLRAYT